MQPDTDRQKPAGLHSLKTPVHPPVHQRSRYLLLLGPGNVPPVPWSSNRGVYSTAAAIMQSAVVIRSWQLLKYFTYPVYLERCDLNIQCLETFERKTERIRQ